MTQYIFIDVDGVLNPDRPREGGFTHLAFPFGRTAPGFNLNLHPVYGLWLNKLSEDTGAFLVWGTTWQEHANEWIGKELDLPHLSHLDLSKPAYYNERLGSIKARAAVEYAQGSEFVYFDDEPDLGNHLSGTKGLHIHVNQAYGLMKRHVIEAEKHLVSADIMK